MNPILLIPARMASARLPGKPLADIAGCPMIVRVWRQAMAAKLGPVVVAAAEPEIIRTVESVGGRAVLTDPDLPSGSDRIFAALKVVDPEGRHDVVVNLQGDLPALEPQTIHAVVDALAGADIGTLAAEITDAAERDNPAVVKAVVAWNADGRKGRALYFTRATAPTGGGALFHHVGIYAFTRAALTRFVALPPSPLERSEKLEQLRALEANMSIAVARVDRVPLSVDTPADLQRANRLFEERPMIQVIAHAKRIAFQGEPGAYANLAAREAVEHAAAIPKPSFEDAIDAVKSGDCDLCIIPVENSLMGRIADIHHLLPDSGLHIVGEHFLPIRHQLLGLKGATLAGIKSLYSQAPALAQCRNLIREMKPVIHNWYDTAGSAKHIAELGDKSAAAVASTLAGELYGLKVLKADVEDEHHNMTRFLIMSRVREDAHPGDKVVTTFVFRVKNVPAALYKAMGGFATNGVNMTKLESYQLGGSFNATQFYADIQGHPQDAAVQRALEELAFYTTRLTILGAYPAHRFREDMP